MKKLKFKTEVEIPAKLSWENAEEEKLYKHIVQKTLQTALETIDVGHWKIKNVNIIESLDMEK